MSPPTPPQQNAKRYWGEEKNIDSIYSIYLKKICYTHNNDIPLSASNYKITTNTTQLNHYHNKQHRKDKINFSQNSKPKHHKSMHELSSTNYLYTNSQPITNSPPLQSLQWETRQIKVLQAATLDHALKFILLINSPSSTTTSSLNSTNTRDTKSSSLCTQANFNNNLNSDDDSILEEERNNVAHITHVMFCTYRIYTNPYELMLKLMDYSDICRIEQYRFVMHYWMDNYPEDFDYVVEFPENQSPIKSTSLTSSTNNNSNNINNQNVGSTSITSYNNSITSSSYDSSMTTRTAATTDSENSTTGGASGIDGILSNLPKSTNGNTITNNSKSNNGIQNKSSTLDTIGSGCSSHSGDNGSATNDDNLVRRLSNLSIKTNNTPEEKSGSTLVNELLRLCRDVYIINKATKLNEMKCNGLLSDYNNSNHHHHNYDSTSKRHNRHQHQGSNSNSAVLDLDSRYVAQQLTAIDLENFLNLKPYSLLDGTKSDKRIQSMIKNFNLLSRHVVVTILKSHNPHIVTSHWITIAINLRKIKNFNSLKAIIAGLTNESIYRLKQIVWSKIDRTSMANFKSMASIVDDVNNQTVLRQTQLIVEGTAKMSIEDDSFGTIPYLGTFLTDLNMIDARYPTYVSSPKDETSKLKLINFEKCAKQFEILTQVQLLQKNVLASLHAIQRRNHFDEQTTLNRLKLEFSQNHQMLLAKPAIPQVSRLFVNWFYDNNVATMTDKHCFEISLKLEQNSLAR